MLYLMGVTVQPISMLRHEAARPYNFNILFPIYTKLLTHVEGIALITSIYSCVISIAWTQETNIID